MWTYGFSVAFVFGILGMTDRFTEIELYEHRMRELAERETILVECVDLERRIERQGAVIQK